MEHLQDLLLYLSAFLLIALASAQIGEFFTKIKLPKITGYLFTGVLVGAFVLKFLPEEAVHDLRFIDEIALGFIAMAAGNELFLPELKGKFKSIGFTTFFLILVTFTLTSITVFLIADYIPFTVGMPTASLVAIAILTGALLIARSPSSAIAIVTELRAKGPYTQIMLGVTVIMDIIVITIFAISTSVADALLLGVGLNISFLLLLLVEMTIAVINAYILYKILGLILGSTLHTYIKTFLILLIGYLVFVLATFFREFSAEYTPFELLVEPLLITMIAGFLITNYSKHRVEFHQILTKTGPYIYVAFFTLTGASLKLDVLAKVWPIALVLVAVRLFAIMIGSFTGGMLAGDPIEHNKLKWMGFVTQAGVALGLAKEVADEFPSFGTEFATMIIAVVVLNQIFGPIFLKYAINKVGEAHKHGKHAPFDGIRDVIIFGLDNQAMALTHQLQAHNWQVKIACTDEEHRPKHSNMDDVIICGCSVFEMSEETFARLEASSADALVTMLSDEENLHICELFYERFGTETIITRLDDRAYFDKFHELGVLIVDPGTAIVSLMEQFVRSPTAVSLLLGDGDGQDMMEITLTDPDLDGVYLRNLRLPTDTLIMSIHRGRDVIVTHGYTKLKLGDRVTVVGSDESLDHVTLLFEKTPV